MNTIAYRLLPLCQMALPWAWGLYLILVTASSSPAEAPVRWLLGHAYKIPSEYTNQESGYFSIIEGQNGRIYIGTAKYGVNAYLIEFDPQTAAMKMVMDVHKVIGSNATGFAAQAKIHTRNNVGASGKIYVGSKQGYPEKGEKRSDYPGGYVLTYDPKSGQSEHFGIAKPQHGIISVTPDEARGVAYVSTCSDERPIDHTHFMILDLKKKTYRDLGDLEHMYAFIVLDHQGRAYHPVRGSQIARYDPATDKLERLAVTVDGKPAPEAISKGHAILNWEVSPDRKTLYAVEMTTNQLFAFDLTATGSSIPGRQLGVLLPEAKKTDCRAMCVGPDGTVWAAVTEHGPPEGAVLHLVSHKPGAPAPRDHGVVGIANPNFTPFVGKDGKPMPWHHALRKAKDGTLSPWVPMGVCAARDGSVYIETIAPFTLIKFSPELLRTAANAQPEGNALDLTAILGREIIGPRQALIEVQEYCDARVPRMPKVQTAAEWEQHAIRIRADVLERVVYRGEAAVWRDAKTKVEWLDTIPGGPGYRIKKLRYEALPGLWIPALLYEPEKLTGKVPVSLAVNGHDRNGKAADYKQIRCINMVRRGMLVLNVEWLGMGQLQTPDFQHYKMNQLDLCGTSGLAPFYLSMKRGLDVLLSLVHADPERVAVSGLSGGGWQTIFISSLDTRVKLANPVAGYSGFRTRIQHHKDLGDSEQTPNDLATIADYNHLTALMAPRPTLLTYNAKDNCCFEAGYALPPLLDAAGPIFQLYGKEKALRSHINHDPGTHNFEKDNRQAFYRMLGDYFFAGDARFDAAEIPCDKEVKTKDDLMVPLPAPNADFHSLALGLAKRLPRDAVLPTDKAQALAWQQARRTKLRDVVRAREYPVQATRTGTDEKAGLKVSYWKLRMGNDWTVPAVELVRGKPKATTVLVADGGRKSTATQVERLLAVGKRVLAIDPLYHGEARIESRDFLFALLIAAEGERLLGLQASQLAAIARWSLTEHQTGPVTVVALGPRTSICALVASGLEEKAIGKLELHGSLGSLKEVIEQNLGVNQMPELFCFGLIEAIDVKQLTAMTAPRPVAFLRPTDRVKTELAGMKGFYGVLGSDFDPLAEK